MWVMRLYTRNKWRTVTCSDGKPYLFSSSDAAWTKVVQLYPDTMGVDLGAIYVGNDYRNGKGIEING